jgi:hypothetical protein
MGLASLRLKIPASHLRQLAQLAVKGPVLERFKFTTHIRGQKSSEKKYEDIVCYLLQSPPWWFRSLDCLSVSRSGKSSSELCSLMVRNPMVGNSLD